MIGPDQNRDEMTECQKFYHSCSFYTLIKMACGCTIELRATDNIPRSAFFPLLQYACAWCAVEADEADFDHLHMAYQGITQIIMVKSPITVDQARELVAIQQTVLSEENTDGTPQA